MDDQGHDLVPELTLWARLVGRDASVIPKFIELAPWVLNGAISEALAPSLLDEVIQCLDLSSREVQVLCRVLDAYEEAIYQPVDSSCVPEREACAAELKQLVIAAAEPLGKTGIDVGRVSAVSTFEPVVYVPWITSSDTELIATLASAARACPYFDILCIVGDPGVRIRIALHDGD